MEIESEILDTPHRIYRRMIMLLHIWRGTSKVKFTWTKVKLINKVQPCQVFLTNGLFRAKYPTFEAACQISFVGGRLSAVVAPILPATENMLILKSRVSVLGNARLLGNSRVTILSFL